MLQQLNKKNFLPWEKQKVRWPAVKNYIHKLKNDYI